MGRFSTVVERRIVVMGVSEFDAVTQSLSDVAQGIVALSAGYPTFASNAEYTECMSMPAVLGRPREENAQNNYFEDAA